MSEPQAEILAGEHSLLIHERLATKRDLQELEASMKSNLERVENRMIIKLGGLFFLGITVLATLITML